MTHLPYDICVKLKEAGLEQKPLKAGDWVYWEFVEDPPFLYLVRDSKDDPVVNRHALSYVKSPSVEDLIEGLGDDFGELSRPQDSYANRIFVAMGWLDGESRDIDPKQALAELYLKTRQEKKVAGFFD